MTFLKRHPLIHAICGIGNPARYLKTLQGLGLSVDLHEYSDHHDFGAEAMFADDPLWYVPKKMR